MLSSSKAKLTTLLSIANLPKSTYYYELKRLNILVEKDKEIYERINFIFNKHKEMYGVRRIYHQLRNEGYVINHKKVQRIMKKLGLKGIRPKEKYHSYKGDVSPFAKNIIDRNFKTDKPNKKWSTDITQFNCQFGKCYLSPIIDMFVGDIVSYDLSMSPNMKQTMNMLNTAITKYDDLKGLILHSDQGWQYQQKFINLLLKNMALFNQCQGKVIAMTIVLSRHSLGR